MIVIGSRAAEFHSVALGRKPKDIDIIGTRQEAHIFKRVNQRFITAEKLVHGHRLHFSLKPALGIEKIEFDFGGSPSDVMLFELCQSDRIPILKSLAYVPSLNLLYLTKRSHASLKINFAKHLFDLVRLKPKATAFSEGELLYYEARKREFLERVAKFPSIFGAIACNDEVASNDKVLPALDQIRYASDDIRRAVAFRKGRPIVERCRRPNSAGIERDLYESLTRQDQLRLAQEEFFVTGIERFYMSNRRLSKRDVYVRGLLKTTRDLFTGWFQDVCFDNMERLVRVPEHDFIGRFEQTERNRELRRLDSEHAHSEANAG